MSLLAIIVSILMFQQLPQSIPGEKLYALGDSAFFNNDYDQAINYYRNANLQFLKEGLFVDQSTVLNDIGLSFKRLGILDSALHYYNESLVISYQLKDTSAISSRLINIGNVLTDKGNYLKAIEHFLLAAKLSSNLKVQARAYNGIGNSYLDQGESVNAIRYYKLAFDNYSNVSNNVMSKAIALGNIGSAHYLHGNIDSAFYYTHQALAIKQGTQRLLSLAFTLEELGRFHLSVRNLDSTDYYLSASLQLREEGADQQGVASVSLLQARYFLETSQYNKVTPKLNIALAYAQQYEDRELLLDCYELLVDYHQSIQNWESAFRFKTDWSALRDSLFNAEKLQVQQIISEQQLQEKEQERLLAAQQARIAEAESQQQQQNARNNLIIASVLAIFLLSSGVGLFIINRQRRKVRGLNVELQQRNEKIKILGEQSMHFTKNALSEITALLNFQSGKLEGVAKDLMQGARLRLDTINILYNELFANKDKEENQVDLGYLISSILGNTLDALLEEKFKPLRQFEIQPVKVSSEAALSMGLIANELCINACKYAFTVPNKRLTVRLMTKESGLYFLFEENGPGLPSGLNWETAKSFGLQLITLLADDLNADLTMENCSPGLKIELTIANH